jgi:UPF0755 protein
VNRLRGLKPVGELTPARRLGVGLAAAGATLGAVALAVALWAAWVYAGPGPKAAKGAATTVVLRHGAGLTEIASTLERAHVVRSSAVFMAVAQATGAARELKAGEYAVASRASMARILSDIRNGRVVRHQLTIPEGYTSEMVADVLAATPQLTGAAPQAPEGSIMPDTYQYVLGDDRAAVLKRMMDARDRMLAQLWAKRQPGLPFTTPEEAVTLASIVEKETGIDSERPRVAAVFVNRLRNGMRLESDPTVIYGITRGRPLGRGLKLSELETPTPYNTYLVGGLPPTPIANPGRASLAAVLDPPKTGDLYFVANGAGGHVFASSFEAHRKNVAAWRAMEKKPRAAMALTHPVPLAQAKAGK